MFRKRKAVYQVSKVEPFRKGFRSKPDARKGVNFLEEEDSDEELFVGCIT